MSSLRDIAQFKSELFAPVLPEQCQFNPQVYGAELAYWLDAFHAAALKAGGKDNGAPGDRPGQSSPIYYAAFVLDPDGNNIEAVYRGGATP